MNSELNGNKDEMPSVAEVFLKRFSTFLSWVLVPLMMPVYGMMLVFSESILSYTSFRTKVVFTLIVFAINVVLPMLFVLVLKKIGLVQDVGLNNRKERSIPYIISIVAFLGSAVYMHFKGAPNWLSMFFVGGALAGVVNFIVNFRWKISAHAAGIAGVVAMLLIILKEGVPQPGCYIWFIVMIVLSGMLGSARVFLGRHTPMQVLCGYAVGFLSVFLLSLS